MILTCIVTYNRLAYTRRCVESYFATKRPQDRLVIVDNASTDGTVDYLWTIVVPSLLSEENRYPGAACNRGWDLGMAYNPTYLHRSDNDIEFLPGWGDEVERAFADNANLSLLGLLNLHEDHGEPNPPQGVDTVQFIGGNAILPARLFSEGLRWSEQPWGVGNAEDADMCNAARRHGWVGRLRRTVANNMAFGRYADYPDYYNETALVRGIRDAEHSV